VSRDPSQDWARLTRLVVARRRELGLSIRGAATTAGLARNTWTTLENGTHRLTDRSYSTVEATLGWAPGSIAAILAGGDPALRGTPPPDPAAPAGRREIGPVTLAHGVRCVALMIGGRHPGAAVLSDVEADALAGWLREQAEASRRHD
jgi:lambda repressor-like predicted transcriptional regulator